jgi:hypothetical protein
MQLFWTMGQMDLSNEILTVSQLEAVGPGVTGVVIDPGISPGFAGKGVFLSFWQAKIIPNKKSVTVLFIFWSKPIFTRLPSNVQNYFKNLNYYFLT